MFMRKGVWDYNQKMFGSQRALKALQYCFSMIKDEVQFTDAFTKALTGKLQEKSKTQFLRLEISAGEGCEGFTYKFKFDSQLLTNDHVLLGQGGRVIFALSEQEVPLVKGSTLDYVKQMMRETFYVKENPNAEISCSCKTSFSPKEFLI